MQRNFLSLLTLLISLKHINLRINRFKLTISAYYILNNN